MEWEVGIISCRLLYIAWVHGTGLLYSTGKLRQDPVINHSGKEYFIKNIYMYLYTCVYMYVSE